MPSNYLALCHPLLSLPSIFPSIRVFSNESVLHIRWPKYWSFSLASVLPVNIGRCPSSEYWKVSFQDWFPLGFSGLISVQSKGLSRVFSNIIVQKYQFFMLSLLYGPTLTSIHDHWKKHSFDYLELCQQSSVSVFKEKASFNFMAAVIICRDLEPKGIKSFTVSISICQKVMRPDAMNVFWMDAMSFLNVEF